MSYPPGRPGYALTDLAKDAVGILDVLGVERAHVVGRSMAGAIALVAGVDHADRVASLTLVCSTPGGGDLPPMSEDFLAYTAAAPDLSDSAAVVEFIVGLMKACSGGSPYFDESAMGVLAEQDVTRTRDTAAA